MGGHRSAQAFAGRSLLSSYWDFQTPPETTNDMTTILTAFSLLLALLPVGHSAAGAIVSPDEQRAALKQAVGEILDLNDGSVQRRSLHRGFLRALEGCSNLRFRKSPA